MAFKRTHARDCQREGLARDLDAFVEMLADIVLNSTFPAEELERERQVILQEFSEFDEDPAAMAFRLFDRACYGMHPAGQPVLGNRANLQRFTRVELLEHAAAQYTAGNVVVAAAGDFDAERFMRAVESAFAAMPAGGNNLVPAAAWRGGLKLRRMAGSSQCHSVLGFEAPRSPTTRTCRTCWRRHSWARA